MDKELRELTGPESRDYFNKLAALVEEQLPLGPSKKGRAFFALLVFDGDGLAQYVSNADRAGIIEAMRDVADRLEERQDTARN